MLLEKRIQSIQIFSTGQDFRDQPVSHFTEEKVKKKKKEREREKAKQNKTKKQRH